MCGHLADMISGGKADGPPAQRTRSQPTSTTEPRTPTRESARLYHPRRSTDYALENLTIAGQSDSTFYKHLGEDEWLLSELDG
jgi:hypothetical protein